MLEQIEFACTIAEKAGTNVTLKAKELRWLLDELKNAYETADDANEEALSLLDDKRLLIKILQAVYKLAGV